MLYISLCLHALCPLFFPFHFPLFISLFISTLWLRQSFCLIFLLSLRSLCFIFVFGPTSFVSFYFSRHLSCSFSRSEVSSWRVVVLTEFILVRISMTPPVCQLSHPATWPGFHRFVFVLRTTTYCLLPVCLTFRCVETWTDRLYIFVVVQI